MADRDPVLYNMLHFPRTETPRRTDLNSFGRLCTAQRRDKQSDTSATGLSVAIDCIERTLRRRTVSGFKHTRLLQLAARNGASPGRWILYRRRSTLSPCSTRTICCEFVVHNKSHKYRLDFMEQISTSTARLSTNTS